MTRTVAIPPTRRAAPRRGFSRANVAGAVGTLGFVALVALYLVSLLWPAILGKV
ncbi:MAG: hypothetical protein HZB16_16325 [Armatimonadetes bacterium]|nr:hypothetical protein [Armatimonadota bacterium]